jgi:hypothetical protein
MVTSCCAGLAYSSGDVGLFQQFAPIRHFAPNECRSVFGAGRHAIAAFRKRSAAGKAVLVS